MRSIQAGPSSSMKKVRKVIVMIARTSEMTLFVIEIAAPVRPSTFEAPPLLTGVPDLLDDVVLRLQEAEPAPALGQVVDVAGQRLDEVVDLVDERRDEGEADARRSQPIART